MLSRRPPPLLALGSHLLDGKQVGGRHEILGIEGSLKIV